MTNIHELILTGYCICELCCAPFADGITASGTKPRHTITAASNDHPFGTRVYIHELRRTVVIEDRMARRFTGHDHLDIFFSSHEEARRFGIRTNTVQIFPPF